MLAPEDRAPSYARVMKVTPTTPPTKLELIPPVTATLSDEKLPQYELDYSLTSEEDISGSGTVDIEEDEGWDVVTSKKRSGFLEQSREESLIVLSGRANIHLNRFKLGVRLFANYFLCSARSHQDTKEECEKS